MFELFLMFRGSLKCNFVRFVKYFVFGFVVVGIFEGEGGDEFFVWFNVDVFFWEGYYLFWC